MLGRSKTVGWAPQNAMVLFLVIMVSLTIISIPSGTGQSSTAISFEGTIQETLEDSDDDGLYEYLVLHVKVNVFEGGEYGLYGSMFNDYAVSNPGVRVLDIGEHVLELQFSGGEISQYGVKGHFQIELQLYSSDSSVDPLSKDIVTEGTYDPEHFEPPEGTGKVIVKLSGDKVLIEGDVMTVSINQTNPQLLFYYTNDEDMKYISSLTYTTIQAHEDSDLDGEWNPDIDQKKYEGDLTFVDWDLDLDVSSGFDISLYGIVQLRLVGTPTVAAWAKVTFRISSPILKEMYVTQKFDIDIDLWQPLDADFISIQHILKDESGVRTIETGPEEGSTESDEFILRLVGERGTQGIYSWTEDITVGSSILDTDIQAGSRFEVLEGEVEIWFTYPLKGDVQLIHHDPTVAMDEKGFIPKDKEPSFVPNNPIIMGLGLLIGLLVVGASIYLRDRYARSRKGGGI
jgi:hypothetical protein